MPRPDSSVRVWRQWSALCLAAVTVVIAAACNNAPPPPATPPTPPVKTDAERATVYQNCWKLYNDKSMDAFSQCYTPTASSEQPDLGPTLNGRSAILESNTAFSTAFPDRHGDLQLVLVNGSHAASLTTFVGTHEGPLPPGPDGKPVPATHKKMALLLAHVADLDATGTVVTRDASYYDQATMMAQLGLLKRPSRLAMAPPTATTIVVVAKHDDTETKNVAAFRATEEAFSKGDTKAFAEMLADDYVAIDASEPKDQNKKEAIAGMSNYKKGFPDAALEMTVVWGAGDYVVGEGRFVGTNTGDLPAMGLKKTGKKVSVRFVEIIRFENGKAKMDWTIFNSAAFAAQLGMK